MSWLPNDLLRRADGELAGGLPNQFMRQVLDLASSDVPLDEVLRYTQVIYSWHQAHVGAVLIPRRTGSSATGSSTFSSRSSTGHWPCSSATSLSFDSNHEDCQRQTIPEDPFESVDAWTFTNRASQQAIRPAKGWLGAIETMPDINTPFRINSSQGDSPNSGPATKLYTCPSCGQGCSRHGELKTHFKKFCYSQSVWLCRKCGHGGQTKKQAERFLKTSTQCKPHDIHEIPLDHVRQVFACPGCGCIKNDLDEYAKHFVVCCKNLGPIDSIQRSRQIRGLLGASHLRGRVENLWVSLELFSKADTIDRLSWNFSPERTTTSSRVVERLEYGERNSAEGVPNLGVASARIDRFLANLILDGLPRDSGPEQPASLIAQNHSRSSQRVCMSPPRPTYDTGTSPLFDHLRCESPQSLPIDEVNHNQPNVTPEPSRSSHAYPLPFYGGSSHDDLNQPVHNIPASQQQVDFQMSDWDDTMIESNVWDVGWQHTDTFTPQKPVRIAVGLDLTGRDGMRL